MAYSSTIDERGFGWSAGDTDLKGNYGFGQYGQFAEGF